ncbi:imidazole glycerol phosphate synthase subunit HisH [Maricaulis sp.]|uniref:imidazole glycerol phosphate synthase subunit HisH n=1 Tax=Maricaulis sp. TaxID=1486257 RepID=UPI0026380930|nr:imidazole glycerol phosphate synthase subunit HisH [Maricaulis sp.]
MTIGLIDTRCANLASVRFALERAGLDYRTGVTPDDLADCDRLILPGVGSARPAMEQLERSGWAEVLAGDTRPLMGICLGMQLLFSRSAEDDIDCLGLIDGAVEKLPREAGSVWPHMGWNTLDLRSPDDPLLGGIKPGEYVYFVHGFYAPVGSYTLASTSYGADCSAIVRQGHVWGCQFHPERSATAGAQILKNFAELDA